MNYQKLSDYMQDEHGVILLETDMQEIVNICREMIENESEPANIDFTCPYCDDGFENTNDKYYKRITKSKRGIAHVKCNCKKTFGVTYDMLGNLVSFKFESKTTDLHPLITHLSTDKPLSEDTLGIVNKMADMAKNEK